MKKIILIAAMICGFAVAASAQPKALGLRFGYGAELSYQHNLKDANFLEVDLGLGEFRYFSAAAAYNFMIAQPSWTDRGEWGFYAGPGVGLGLGFTNAENNGGNSGIDERSVRSADNSQATMKLGILGQVGLEYTFWFPLQLSVDIRPQLSLVRPVGIWGWYPHLSARYRF